MLDELRAELPGDLRRAAALLEERDKIMDAGKREADRIISEGEAEHARLVSVNEITVSRRARGRPDHRRGPRRGAAPARGGRRLRRHRAGQLRAVPHPGAGLDRARPGQDARAARDRHLRRARRTSARCRSERPGPALSAGCGSTVGGRSGNLSCRPLTGRSLTMPKHTQNHLDPRSPLVLDTRDLPRRPGAMRAVERVVPAPADLGLELIGVPEGADLEPRSEARVGVRGRARLRDRPRSGHRASAAAACARSTTRWTSPSRSCTPTRTAPRTRRPTRTRWAGCRAI